ncbi:hypothetical protein [Escherichia coli]|nr:hypothetical protein [Escherichia coli]
MVVHAATALPNVALWLWSLASVRKGCCHGCCQTLPLHVDVSM